MKYILLIIGAVLIIGGITIIKNSSTNNTHTSNTPTTPSSVSTSISTNDTNPQSTIIAQNLDTPWAIAFLPDKSMLITERPGTIRFIDSNGNLDKTPIATIEKVQEIGEGGLLGIAVHPDFAKNKFIYLYYTYSNSGNDTLNRVVRIKYENKKLRDEKIIVDKIPGASNHNGGRIKFGPDKLLYIGTGDAQNPSQAQNTKTLGGKILRVTDEGKIPTDNPFNNLVYSYGHRNVQGLTWDSKGNLWATEHGRSGVLSGFDELNFIEKGKNYGWPDIQGNETRQGMETPRKNSGGSNTWAPSGIAYLNGSVFFGGLRGQSLYQAMLNGNDVADFKEYFKGEFGRVRDVVAGPDGMVYVTTSNQDGRGDPQNGDDKIIKINSSKL